MNVQRTSVTIRPLVLGGLRPLYRQMRHNRVRTVRFEHDADIARFDVCLTDGHAGAALEIRSPRLPGPLTLALGTNFRAEPALDPDVCRALCAVLKPGEPASAATVVRFLQDVVAQAPAVLSRTEPCAACA